MALSWATGTVNKSFWCEFTMTKRNLISILGLMLLLAFGIQSSEAHGPGHNPSRHQFVMRNGVPEAYQELMNPLRMSPENLSNGQTLYNEHCAFCHGPTGQGDGQSAAALDPTPPRLTGMYDRPMHGMGHATTAGHLMHGKMHHHPGMTHAEAMGGLNLDAYTFWSVSEGGEPMGSSMPAFKNILSERERWQILPFIANGFSTDGVPGSRRRHEVEESRRNQLSLCQSKRRRPRIAPADRLLLSVVARPWSGDSISATFPRPHENSGPTP